MSPALHALLETAATLAIGLALGWLGWHLFTDDDREESCKTD